jgi:hypothetical protein
VKQNLFQQYDGPGEEDGHVPTVSNMEFKPTISILDDHKQSQQSSRHHMASTHGPQRRNSKQQLRHE